jgi:hypothetical protein
MMVDGGYMNTEIIIEQIDVEIRKLQEARALLNGTEVEKPVARGPGRPKKSAISERILSVKPARRKMTAEGKARVAAAQKARWAKARKAAKKAPAKATKKVVEAKA